MKIVFFGCQQIAVDLLDFLRNQSEVEIPLVVTYELPLDETYGYKSVLKYCEVNGIRVINPRLVDENVVHLINDLSPDLILSIYYRKIFPSGLLKIPPLGCINIHPSALPAYRGPVPTAWAIENGEKTFGITIHYMDQGIDTGDILIQKVFPIYPEETGFELYTRAMSLGAELFIENFIPITKKLITPVSQIGVGSYYGKRSGKYFINWRNKAENIKNLIRVHAKPFNPAESILFNRYILINKAQIYDSTNIPLQGAGKIVKVLPNGNLVVSCVDGYLLITEYEIVPQLNATEKQIYLREGNKFE